MDEYIMKYAKDACTQLHITPICGSNTRLQRTKTSTPKPLEDGKQNTSRKNIQRPTTATISSHSMTSQSIDRPKRPSTANVREKIAK